MNILYLSGCFDMGGTEVYTMNLAEGMGKRGHTVFWATRRNGRMRPEAERHQINLLYCPLNRRNPFSVFANMWRLRNIVKKHHIELVHAADAFSALVYAFAKRLFRLPAKVIWSNVGIGAGSYSLMYKVCGHSLDGILAVSHYIRNRTIEAGFAPETICIYHGPRDMIAPTRPRDEVRAQWGITKDDLVIGTVGRIVYQKGNRTVIDALPALLEKYKNLYLVMVGDGPDVPHLREQAARLGVADRVIITGFRTDIENCYPAFDVVAFPTYLEALGYIPMEAWFYEKPLVASYTGGVPEIVIPEYNGLLAAPGMPREWTAALDRLLSDTDLQHTLVQNGTKTFQERMTRERSLRLLDEIYSEVV